MLTVTPVGLILLWQCNGGETSIVVGGFARPGTTERLTEEDFFLDVWLWRVLSVFDKAPAMMTCQRRGEVGKACDLVDMTKIITLV